MAHNTVVALALVGFVAIMISLSQKKLADAGWFQWLIAIAGAAAIVATITSYVRLE